MEHFYFAFTCIRMVISNTLPISPSYSEKNCILDREHLRQRVMLCDTLLYTVDVLREQLNTSSAREERLTNVLQSLSYKLGAHNVQNIKQ